MLGELVKKILKIQLWDFRVINVHSMKMGEGILGGRPRGEKKEVSKEQMIQLVNQHTKSYV